MSRGDSSFSGVDADFQALTARVEARVRAECESTLRCAQDDRDDWRARAEAAEHERDQARALLLAIEAAIPGNTYTSERNALDAVVDLVAERDQARATVTRVTSVVDERQAWLDEREDCDDLHDEGYHATKWLIADLAKALKGPVTT